MEEGHRNGHNTARGDISGMGKGSPWAPVPGNLQMRWGLESDGRGLVSEFDSRGKHLYVLALGHDRDRQ